MNIMDRLQAARLVEFNSADREVAARSIADTLAVAAAGYCAPKVKLVSNGYAAPGHTKHNSWDGVSRNSTDDAAFVDAIAAHALDFDDVDTFSWAHLSSVVVPVLLADHLDAAEDELLDALLTGIVAAGEIARWLGPDHYRRGWHATSTIGTLAACISLARIQRMTVDAVANAIAISASQLAGIQASFGSDTKALHVGFAVVSARRAIRLASLGLTGEIKVFEHPSFLENYGTNGNSPPDLSVAIPPLSQRQLTKIYPCCFALHGAIAAVLEARKTLGEAILNDSPRFNLTLPQDAIAILQSKVPSCASEAAFSAAYCCAAALVDGTVGINHFAEDFGDPRIVAVASRFSVRSNVSAPGARVSDGQTLLAVHFPNGSTHQFLRQTMSGGTDDSAINCAFVEKTRECLRRYRQDYGHEFPVIAEIAHLPRVSAYLGVVPG